MTSVSSRPRPYPWLEPSVINKDAKYRVTADGAIRLIFPIDRRERELLTTHAHPELVEKVAAVKAAHGEPPSGVFYLNEWRHLLVKAGGGTWFAGRYERQLDFDLDGKSVSTMAPAGLEPGQPWKGPHVGVRYTLAASGDDVYCRRRVTATRERDEYLSDYVPSAVELVRQWAKIRPGGGRLYINEARELFTPAGAAGVFTYVGRAPLDRWFPEPQVDQQG